MNRWDGLVEKYVWELEVRGLSKSTIEMRCGELDRWGSWLKHRRPQPRLEAVGTEEVVEYMKGRAAFRSKSTVAGVMSVLRNMGEFLEREGVWHNNAIRWMRGPKIDPRSRAPRGIGRKTMEGLWETAATGRQEYQRYLWMAMLGVLYGTGVRREELTRLNLSDWRREEGTLLIDGAKTKRERCAALPPLTWRCLEAYQSYRQTQLELRGIEGEQALFINQSGKRVSPSTVSRGLKNLSRRCGVDGITLHRFRHSCATDLLENGVRVPEIQRMLGHQRIETTVRYLHVADPQRHEAVKLHPINRMLGCGGAA